MARYSADRGKRFISVGPAIPASAPDVNANTTPINPGTATGPGDEMAYVPGADSGSQFPLALTWDFVVGGTGSLTALTVALQGSNDGANWTTIDSDNTGVPKSKALSNNPYIFYRLNITTFTVASGAPVVQGGITQ